MELQYFGTVQTGELVLDAMLCRDIDKPAEAMVHVWSNEIRRAFLCDCEIESNSCLLVPRTFFSVSEHGGIYLSEVPQELKYKFHTTRAKLALNQDGCYWGSWINGAGETGVINFEPSRKAEIAATDCKTWKDFQDWSHIMRREKNATFFRGHGSNKFKLETTLQRNGRHRLERYCAETLQQFHRHAEAALNVRIDMNNGDDYSMLLGLAQHYGLPTPLLDWSASPYVAAFFAFADALENRNSRKEVTKVRIFALTTQFIQLHSTQTVMLPYFKPYISPLEMSFRNNPRLYAQKGCFTVTNTSNFDSLIQKIEVERKEEYLFAVDLPVRLAVEVLEELAYMGLSGATLFPGLEGVSRMLKHEMAFRHAAVEVISQPEHVSADGIES